MPELNHKFTLGKMNKDADERLVLNGEYRDALNVQVATSDGSDIGTLQNLLGSTDVSHDFINFDTSGVSLGDFEYQCVGSIVDGKTDRIYWMLSGVGKDIIAEYDYITKKVSPVVVDIYNTNTVAGAGSGRVLNFDKNFLITGINIVDDFLFWTDNNTEPKQISIQRSKMGCINPVGLLPDFNYQTDLYVKTRKPENQVPPFVNVGVLKEEHITVIKKAPRTAPRLEMKNTLREDTDSDGVYGNTETTITFNDGVLGDPVVTLLGGTDSWVTTEIAFQTDSLVDYETGDFLTLTLSGSGAAFTSDQELSEIVIQITSHIEYNYEKNFLTTFYGLGSDLLDPNGLIDTLTGQSLSATNIWFKASIVSGNLLVNAVTDKFNVSLKQSQSLFKFKFPRFGSRYKYTDGQYSTFSPFSEVAFLPSKFDYLPKEGYNLGMVNSVRKLAIKDFVDKNQIPDDVVEIDILYKESNSPIVYTVDTVKRVDIIKGKYDSWNAVNANDTSEQNTTGFINISSEVIHVMVPSNQLLRSWDNVPRKALAQEIVGNRIVYGNYLQNYNMENSSNFLVPALGQYGINKFYQNSNITVDTRLKYTSRSLEGTSMVPELLNPFNANSYSPAKSIKTLRTYQVGVSYIDEFGRETPVFSSSKSGNNSIQVDKATANQAGSLRAQMFSTPPEWAKNFKFLIKESSNEYYNLAMDRWYQAQDGNIWLSFPSAERNKVDDETFLILKKRHNNDQFVSDSTKYKILAIENEAPLFIKTKKVPKKNVNDGVTTTGGGIRIIGTAPAGSNDNTTGFPTPGFSRISFEKTAISSLITIIEREGISGWEFRVRQIASGTSDWYKIQSFDENLSSGYVDLISKKRFGVDMNITNPVSWDAPLANTFAHQNIKVEFVRNEVNDLPEFDGRFFVKVLADSTIKKAIVGQTVNGSTEWQVTDAIRSQYINPEPAYANTFPSSFFAVPDIDLISIEEMNIADKNNLQHEVHNSSGFVGGGGGGEYWDWAGKTNFNDSSSSGWFIDKIEAFRPWNITGKQGWDYASGSSLILGGYTAGDGNKDDKFNTNQYTGNFSWGAFSVVTGATDEQDLQQLKLVGTNTHSNPMGVTSYLNQTDLKAPGNMLQSKASYDYGGIIPSLGIDKTDNIIHLSYAGVGLDESPGNITTLAQLKTDFTDNSWANNFTDQVSFITTITQQGALWRWKEDPDGIVYVTTGYDTSMTGLTSVEWDNNFDDRKDGNLGVSLYNYTQFCDYIVAHKRHYKVNAGIFPDFEVPGSPNMFSHFVSMGKRDESVYGIAAPAVFAVDSLDVAIQAFHAQTEISLIPSAKGLGVGAAQPHHEYPSYTKEWGKARNRRRRYMFAARPFQDANGAMIDPTGTNSLGNVTNNPTGASPAVQTGNYLPTNDPSLEPHFLDDGTVLTRDLAVSLAAGVPLRPLTDAPGIRPDGVYTGYDLGSLGQVPAFKTTTTGLVVSEAPGSCTFEILIPYLETDDSDSFTTTNPAIWETEPKEDLDLDLYYEVGQIYPTELNKTTMEQFVGPIRDYDVLVPGKNLNTKVSCFRDGYGFVNLNSGGTYDFAAALAAGDISLQGQVLPGADDIRVVSHEAPGINFVCSDHFSLTEADCLSLSPSAATNTWSAGDIGSDHHVWLEDVNGIRLVGDDATLATYPRQIAPEPGDYLTFTREDGSTTGSYIETQAQITGPTINSLTGIQQDAFLINAYELDSNSHNYEVSLPWHNCYSFGNGVESNRIRDDYNQVFIDKGAKVSTVLEEPYLEDRRSSGLIYSGIYNSISNINNLNQFIQAEKITKDLNPDGGSIQKLYTRDTNLITICEDKVFKILAQKDALFNADGNPQLVATDKVLGQATTFAGDHGISNNPESFAVDSFRMYFTDRVRGAVIRLSMDGITPISSIGMADWFNDNLVDAKRLIGSFDDKKKEYNLNLGYFDYATYSVDILCDARTTPEGLVSYSAVPPGVLVLNGSDASKFSVGDIVNGEGIAPGSIITAIDYQGGGAWWIKLNQSPDIADLWALLPQGQTFPYVYGDYFTFPTRITASVETQPSNTLSFSEKNKGWISFKSFLKEDGLSLNNEYFTFKHGMLNQHHTNSMHNNFYGEQFDSSVEVLFNELPGSVKSFGSLSYEGSQSHITQDLQNSAEYWDNKNKLGWYVSNIHTDLQEGSLHEFKDKENKWFSQVKGVATKWLDDGKGGNIDTNEFSYQGIDDNDGVTIIDGGYTSWDCVPQPATLCGRTFIQGLPGLTPVADASNPEQRVFPILEYLIDNYPSQPFNNFVFETTNNLGDIIGGSYLVQTDGLAGTHLTGDDVLNTLHFGNVPSGATWANSYNSGMNAYFFGAGQMLLCDVANAIPPGNYACTEIPGLSGAYANEQLCLADPNTDCGAICTYAKSYANFSAIVVNATDSICATGSVHVNFPVLDPSASFWNVSYTAVNVPTRPTGAIENDPVTYYFFGDSNSYGLAAGEWSATAVDSNGCVAIEEFEIFCNYNPQVSCVNNFNSLINVVDATEDGVGNCPLTLADGNIDVTVTAISQGATTWSVEYFQLVNGVLTLLFFDDNYGSGYQTNSSSYLSNLTPGDYVLRINDDAGCTVDQNAQISCVASVFQN